MTTQNSDPGKGEGLDKGENEIKNRNDWLRAAYAEAWKQYTHEDTLTMQRNNLFIIIQTALLATLASTTTALIKVDPLAVGIYSIYIGYIFIGVLILVFAFFASKILNNWQAVTESGQAYVSLRWSTCNKIEEVVGLQDIGVSLAGREYGLQKVIKDKKDDYQPYPGCPSLKKLGIESLGTIGWDSIKHLISALRAFWIGLCFPGIIFVIIGLILTLRSPGTQSSSRTVTISGPVTVVSAGVATTPAPNLPPNPASSPTPVHTTPAQLPAK